MPFPQTPLPVSVQIAPGSDPANPGSYAFTDITADVRVAPGIQIRQGRQDEGARVDASACQLTVDNKSGNYSTRNPLGTWYGSLAKGTPLQVAITRIADTFTRSSSPGLGTDTDSGLTWSHDVSSPWDVNGSNARCSLASASTATWAYLQSATGADMEVTCSGALSAVTTGAAWVHAAVVRMIDTNNYYRLHTEFTTAGTIGCKIAKVVGGVLTDLTTTVSTGVSYTVGTKINMRARIVGNTLQVRAWLNSGTEPTTWTCQVDDASLVEAGMAGLYEWRVVGNTNAGTLICAIDNYRVDVIRSVTPVPEWPTRWNQPATTVTAPISGAGILRRLSQGQSALRSPMYRQLPRYSPTGFWPLEDGTDSTTAASALPGGQPATCSDVTFGAVGPPGASAAITLNNASSSIRGSCPASGSGFSAMICFKQASAVAADSTLAIFNATGTVRQWQLVTAAGGSVKLNGFDSSGATVVAGGPIVWGTADPTQWCVICLQVTDSGGTVSWNLAWIQVSEPIISFATGSFSGSAGAPNGFVATGTASMSYAMCWLGPSTLPFFSLGFYSVFNGFVGETAGARLVRLAAEEGVPLAVIGDTAATAPMGAQRLATLLDLFHECEDADQGTLHERGAGLGYLTRVARYNPATALALDFASGHVAEPPEPTDDDQRLRNRIVLTRVGGSSTTVQDDTSIALSGAYSDEISVNLASDGDLTGHAYWRLHLGTLDDLRWPRIDLSLVANPSLIPLWCKVRIGSRITIANPPAAVAGASLDLIVEGWTETLGPYRWDVSLVCSPAAAWNVGVYGDTTRRYDLSSCTLNGSHAAGVTSLALTIANDESWSTTAVPYDLLISGEQVTVTAMGARSGSGPYAQTATVTRAVNGVAKLLPSGSEVHIATPGRWAL